MKNLPEMKIFTSELGHYSIEKAAIMLGFGLDSIIKIKSDKNGKMIPSDLEE